MTAGLTKSDLLEFAKTNCAPPEKLAGCDIEQILHTLTLINEILTENTLMLDAVERLETIEKKLLTQAFSTPLSGEHARLIANYTKSQGFIFKYKPYAVKAASPFGYSIFLQRPNEGFSYQNHLKHKTEVFHILKVLPGGFVFLCHYDAWKRNYDKQTFEGWLAGNPHPFFDRCRFVPQPGDTFIIAELGIVHTVIGCILEEFATTSTDMVQRLHDQNDRANIPSYSVDITHEQLKNLKLPDQARKIEMLEGDQITVKTIQPEEHAHGTTSTLLDGFVRASHSRLLPFRSASSCIDRERVTLIRVFAGTASVLLRDQTEHERNLQVLPILLSDGEMLAIPPGSHFTITNPTEHLLSMTEHRIAPSVALES